MSYVPIQPSQVHVFDREEFIEHFSGEGDSVRAFYRQDRGDFIVNRSQAESPLRLLLTLMHEAVHRAAKERFYVSPEKAEGSVAQAGYTINSAWKEDKNLRLEGFNEIVVEYTARKIVSNNAELVASRTGSSVADVLSQPYSYAYYVPVLRAVTESVALQRGISETAAFIEIERAQFGSTILVLKHVEAELGKGSLRVLSLLRSIPWKSGGEELDDQIISFFESDSAEEREVLRQDIEIRYQTLRAALESHQE